MHHLHKNITYFDRHHSNLLLRWIDEYHITLYIYTTLLLHISTTYVVAWIMPSESPCLHAYR